jgi:uncharacterized membrane protein
MRVLRVPFVLAVAAALASCGQARDTAASPASACPVLPTATACPANPTLTYANFGQSFFATFCLRCHSVNLTGDARNGATIGVNFDTLDGIRAHLCRIDDFAGKGPITTPNDKFMPFVEPQLNPPEQFPTDGERSQLSQWLACGAQP